MRDDTRDDAERRGVGEAVRRACLRAAVEAYEQAREDGLCAEGAWEAAVAAIYAVDVAVIAGRAADLADQG